MINPHDRERGNILISVLWVMMAMTIIVMGLSYEARADIERTLLMRNRSKAYWLARAAVERVKYDFAASMTSQIQGTPVEESGKKVRFTYQFDEGWADCIILTNASKMSLNSQNRDQWLQLFSLYGLDDQEKDEIVDAILDWRDSDDLQRLNGAEAEYYQTLSPPYAPRNGPFFSVEEVMLVRGVTETMYYGGQIEDRKVPGLKDILGISNQNLNRFDINTCPAGVLMAFLELNEDEAQQIISAREQKMFENLDDVRQIIPINADMNLNRYFMPYQGANSQGFIIRATAHINGSPARYTVEDEVRYIGGAQLYTNVSHKDFSLDHVKDVQDDEVEDE